MAAKKGKRPDNAPRNFVHLHGIAFNHAATHADKRKDAKMAVVAQSGRRHAAG